MGHPTTSKRDPFMNVSAWCKIRVLQQGNIPSAGLRTCGGYTGSGKDFKFVNFLIEGFAVDAQDFGRLGLIAAGFGQDGNDMIFFHFLRVLGCLVGTF